MRLQITAGSNQALVFVREFAHPLEADRRVNVIIEVDSGFNAPAPTPFTLEELSLPWARGDRLVFAPDARRLDRSPDTERGTRRLEPISVFARLSLRGPI